MSRSIHKTGIEVFVEAYLKKLKGTNRIRDEKPFIDKSIKMIDFFLGVPCCTNPSATTSYVRRDNSLVKTVRYELAHDRNVNKRIVSKSWQRIKFLLENAVLDPCCFVGYSAIIGGPTGNLTVPNAQTSTQGNLSITLSDTILVNDIDTVEYFINTVSVGFGTVSPNYPLDNATFDLSIVGDNVFSYYAIITLKNSQTITTNTNTYTVTRNTPPTFNNLVGSWAVNPSKVMHIAGWVSDVNNISDVVFTFNNLPAFASPTPTQYEYAGVRVFDIEFSPLGGDEGTYTFDVIADDGYDQITKSYTILVDSVGTYNPVTRPFTDPTTVTYGDTTPLTYSISAITSTTSSAVNGTGSVHYWGGGPSINTIYIFPNYSHPLTGEGLFLTAYGADSSHFEDTFLVRINVV